jgi:hypothetical protein
MDFDKQRERLNSLDGLTDEEAWELVGYLIITYFPDCYIGQKLKGPDYATR